MPEIIDVPNAAGDRMQLQSPISAPPHAAAALPSMDTAPSVPGLLGRNVVIIRGCCEDNEPNSDASVSARDTAKNAKNDGFRESA